ncbi:hypothetical protein ACOMHN_046448 [Nucella lapillus]
MSVKGSKRQSLTVPVNPLGVSLLFYLEIGSSCHLSLTHRCITTPVAASQELRQELLDTMSIGCSKMSYSLIRLRGKQEKTSHCSETNFAVSVKGHFLNKTGNGGKSETSICFLVKKQKLFLEKAVLTCAYKKDMVRHNIEKVNANNQPIALIKAESKPKGEANNTSAERDSGLTSVIALSKDTVFRLSCNLWTEAGLTNGEEFALGLLFVGASRVKRFEDLTFEPFPNFERSPQIAKCTSLKERLQEEERMKKQEENTITLLQVPLEDAQQAAKVHAESINQPQEYPAKSYSMPVDVQCACAMDEIEEMEVIEDITSSPEVLELSVDQPCQDLTPSLIVLKGIDNLGNTCYMNCILQCLFHVNTVSE